MLKRIFKLVFIIRLLRFFSLVVLLLILSGHFTIILAQADAQIRKIEFKGNHVLSSGELLSQMNTKTKTQSQRLIPWAKWPRYSSHVLNDDISRLKKHYQRNGFLSPEIEFDVKLTGKKERVNIQLKILEGDPVLVSGMVWEGISSDKFPFIENIKKQLSLQIGNRFTDQKLIKSQEYISKEFMNNGYPGVRVEYLLTVSSNRLEVAILWMITPDNLAYFGELSMKGNEHIDSTYILKHVRFKKGERFSRNKLEETQQELFDLGLFRYLTVKGNTEAIKDSLVPILLSFKESPRWSLQTGIGFGTDDRLRISGTLTRLHFFGGTRKLIFNAKRSHFFPLGIDVKFIQPDLFT